MASPMYSSKACADERPYARVSMHQPEGHCNCHPHPIAVQVEEACASLFRVARPVTLYLSKESSFAHMQSALTVCT